MDMEINILSEECKTEKDKYHVILLICGIKKKLMKMNLLTKQKQTHRHRKQIYGCQRRKRVGRDKLGVWDQQIETTIYKIYKQAPTV